MSLATVAHVRALIANPISDANLQIIIDREEAELVRRYGAHGDGSTSATEIHEGGLPSIWLRRKAVSITSITENYVGGTSPTTLVSTDYYRWVGTSQIVRLPAGARWGFGSSLGSDLTGNTWQPLVTVVYVPADDRDLRRQVIIELVRIALEQTAMESESGIASSYKAPNWEKRRAAQYRRLTVVDC